MRGMALVFSASSACRSRREYVSGPVGASLRLKPESRDIQKKLVGSHPAGAGGGLRYFRQCEAGQVGFKRALNNKVPSCRSASILTTLARNN